MDLIIHYHRLSGWSYRVSGSPHGWFGLLLVYKTREQQPFSKYLEFSHMVTSQYSQRFTTEHFRLCEVGRSFQKPLQLDSTEDPMAPGGSVCYGGSLKGALPQVPSTLCSPVLTIFTVPWCFRNLHLGTMNGGDR